MSDLVDPKSVIVVDRATNIPERSMFATIDSEKVIQGVLDSQGKQD